MNWINVKNNLPNDFDEKGRTKHYLVYIDNPFFKDGNYHVAIYEKSSYGEQYNQWRNIEPNVHHVADSQPNVTHWAELEPPTS